MIKLASCPKKYALEQDKACSPADTLHWARLRLAETGLDVLASTRRIDTGRLAIPVYLGICGKDAMRCMPTRKQMGKGASPQQAEASALMELVERFSFFSFWERLPNMVQATWDEAEQAFGDTLVPLEEMLFSVHDPLPPNQARRALNLVRWKFFPATCLNTQSLCQVPLDWFRKLGEFNGSSAGNTTEESLLQGLCELVERHVCALADKSRGIFPLIETASCTDPVLRSLVDAFAQQGIKLVLKDFSCGLPVPTVAALAWDPASFPAQSELVFTAGTAASPVKAAIRAITEVAQLAGDFCTNACYEASGLPKFTCLEEVQWLLQGPHVPLHSLPSIESDDIHDELVKLLAGLKARNYTSYSIATTHPALKIPAHYSMVPGFAFRERDANQSLGLFIGRMLAEEYDENHATHGLTVLDALYPGAHFVPFFQGLIELRQGKLPQAEKLFLRAYPLQPDADARGLAAFYAAYSATQAQEWARALPLLDLAVQDCPEMKEYWNLRGVAHFKRKAYAEAAENFSAALRLDKGSALDLANLGLCYKFMGNKSEAVHCLSTALTLDPELDFARAQLAELTS